MFTNSYRLMTNFPLSISIATATQTEIMIEVNVELNVEVKPEPLPRDLAIRHKRLWVLALGTAAVWHLGTDFGEMADMIGLIACTANKSLAGGAIAKMRAKAEVLRAQIAPLEASALSKVIRRTEAACGAVLDKAVRMKELQRSWDHFLACVRVKQD